MKRRRSEERRRKERRHGKVRGKGSGKQKIGKGGGEKREEGRGKS